MNRRLGIFILLAVAVGLLLGACAKGYKLSKDYREKPSAWPEHRSAPPVRLKVG